MTIQEALHSPHFSIPNEMILDLRNDVSAGTAGVYLGKSVTHEHQPYVIETIDSVKIIVHNFHFLSEMRRQLSGDVEYSKFSVEEQAHYDDYISYVDGTVFTGDKLLLVEALDLWLVDETRLITHPKVTRNYEKGINPWRKLDGES